MTPLFTNEVICFVAHDASMSEHFYHCLKLVVSFKGTYSCLLDGQKLTNVSGHILNRSTPHACEAVGASVLVYCIDPGSLLGRTILTFLGERAWVNISDQVVAEPLRQILDQGQQNLQGNITPGLAFDVMNALFPLFQRDDTLAIDERVTKIVNYVDEHLHKKTLSLVEMAELISLSPDRTRHLFDEEIGAPFRQYVLWKRIKLVIHSVVNEDLTLSKAAHHYGFADQSHFNRIFKRMFGSNPAYLLKKNIHTQFLIPFVD
ncbi:helix-turn-helix domain-containing protein [Spirosoma endophyticum]|uniref:AraC-type DNA-binding protein n=1 Tax=Spirosoma endophyticum TaxID=662367 RepID=A0A1I1VL40_9BACT|nr:AraC family transcriptional regulator [Spirosoma endophyticum]SFD83792.1 AraC-type DNA-binding protein [Spirosoma endophyticum]